MFRNTSLGVLTNGINIQIVFMKMEEISEDKPGHHGDTILVARFTMVARDALTGKAAQVNPMLLQNDTEKKLFQMGEGKLFLKAFTLRDRRE